jgi:K+-sensing histidine kinase KdpD
MSQPIALTFVVTSSLRAPIIETLRLFYAQVERPDSFRLPNTRLDLLLTEYAALPKLKGDWREVQERGGMVLLLIPEGDDQALAYALESGVDDYIVFAPNAPLDVRVLAHRVQRMKKAAEAHTLHYQSEMRLVEALQSTALALSSTLDFEGVLDRILINLEQVVPYDLADVAMLEENVAFIVRHRGYVENDMGHVVPQMRFPTNQFKTLSIMAATGKPLYVPDTEGYEGWQAVIDEMNWRRSYLGAPLFVKERLVGFLNLNSKTVDAYTPDDMRRLEVFASQVSVAISNAQWHDTVLRHSLELEQRIKDVVTVYEIEHALASTLNLQEIYLTLYEKVAQELFAAPQMRVILIDNETGNLYYDCAIAEGEVIDNALLSISPEEQAILNTVIKGQQPYTRGNSAYEPLMSRNEVIGVLQILHYEQYDFDEVDITLLSTVSTLAAVAIENAQLYTTINSQHHEIAALYRATTVLFASDNVAHMAQQITDTIVKEFRQTGCRLMVSSQEDTEIEVMARSGEYLVKNGKRLHINGSGLVPAALRTGEMIYAPDVKADPRYVAGEALTRSELVIPLRTPRGILGVLDLQSKQPNAYSERDVRIIKAFAERAAIALENMHLLEQTRRYASDLEQRVAERTEELRKALEKERELSELKTRFITTVSHQFRTPLTAIQSAKEMLKHYGERMTPEQRNVRYDMLDSAVMDMVRLIEDSIMMNRITGGDLMIIPVLVDLNSFTRDTINDFGSRAGKTHRIVYASDTKEAFNLVDTDMWRKVVNELLLNATKFSEPGSQIECQLSTMGGDFVLTVKDEGMGIAPEDVGRVFGIFDRGMNAENIPGAGLGLAIVKQSIERHGGHVEVSSQLGVGTTVSLHLPKYVLEVVR